jgi:hypothetical protein
MPGGVIQLISTGNHDIYLTGCPQITYFKKVYKKYTHFALEAIEQEFNNGANYGTYVSATLCRDADLLAKLLLEMKYIVEPTTPLDQLTSILGTIYTNTGIHHGTFSFDGSDYLIFTSSSLNDGSIVYLGDCFNSGSNVTILTKNINLLNTITGSTNYTFTTADIYDDRPRIATRLIEYIELTIAGQLIDRLYGEWIDIWLQLSSSYEKWSLLENMLYGKNPLVNNNSVTYLPIPFWFSKNYGLALPMISLQYHEVKCNIQFKDDLYGNGDLSVNIGNIDISGENKIDSYSSTLTPSPVQGTISNITLDIPLRLRITDSRLYGDYIFLDTDERRLFAGLKQEYLIEQTQYSNKLSLNSGININELHFNHPVKELVWFYQLLSNNNTFNYWDNSGNDLMKSCKLEYNGVERFKTKNNHYFRLLQPYYHHTGAYLQDISGELGGFYNYSFALQPELYQPSGTCNFSRINNVILYSNVTQDCNMAVYSTNYNVLRIMNGMAGLGYGN